jgi:hypothetical protein
MVDRRRLRRVLAAVALAVTAVAALGIGVRATYGTRTTADEPQYLLSAISLAHDRDLDVSDERAALAYRPFHERALPQQALIQADGSQVNPHDPLLPALLAAPVWLGGAANGWVIAKLALAVVGGVLAALLAWLAVRRLGLNMVTAVAVVGVFAASAPLAVYATQVYPEIVGALAVTAAFAAITAAPSRGAAAVTAVALGAMPWLSVKYVFVAGALAAVAAVQWWRSGDRRLVAGLAGGLLLAGVAYVAFSRHTYGGWTPYAAGSTFVDGETTVIGTHVDLAARSSRLLGLLTDRNYGLLVWQPAFVLAIPALAALLRRRPRWWPVAVVPLTAGWLNATFVAFTMHGVWWPGRQTVVVLPLAVLTVAWWAATVVPTWWRAVVAVGALGVVTYGWLMVEGLARRLTLVVDPTTTTNPLVRALRPLLPDYQQSGAGTWIRHGVWIALVSLAALAGWHSARRPLFIPNPPPQEVPFHAPIPA